MAIVNRIRGKYSVGKEGPESRLAGRGRLRAKRDKGGCRGRDSNPHDQLRSAVFETAAYTIPPPRRCQNLASIIY